MSTNLTSPPVSAPRLSVAEYDSAEREAMERLPNRVIEAFRPVTFDQRGYPSRVRFERELVKFVDVMHEGRTEWYATRVLGGVTAEEHEQLTWLTRELVRWTASAFGVRRIARAGVFSSLNVLRHIRHLFADDRPRVFEIGPGCGYLGALLQRAGYPYAATDAVQAFYLYQHHLWHALSGGGLVELANPVQDAAAAGGSLWSSKAAAHVPWWVWARWDPSSAPEADLVLCNHALNEMHPNCLRLTLRMCRAMLRGAGKKAFLFDGWGASNQGTQASTEQAFYRAGFALVHTDRWATMFVPADSEHARHGTMRPRLCERAGFRARLRWALVRRIDRRVPGRRPPYQPGEFVSRRNALSRAILDGRRALERKPRTGLADLDRFYAEQLGTPDLRSPDERFLELAA